MRLLKTVTALSLALSAPACKAIGIDPAPSADQGATQGEDEGESEDRDDAETGEARVPRGARPRFVIPESRAARQAQSIPVTPGLVVRSAKGAEIGKVERMVARPNGRVVSFLVNMGDRSAMIPAFRFTRTAEGLTSSLDEAAIRAAISVPFVIDEKYKTDKIAAE